MRPRQTALTAVVFLAAMALAACGGSGGDQGGAKTQSEKDAYQVTSDVVKAAAEQDGKKYCESLTLDLLERTAEAESDAANKQCEQQVKAGSGKLPLRVSIKPGQASEQSGETTVKTAPPNARIKLRKEDGKLKVDSVE